MPRPTAWPPPNSDNGHEIMTKQTEVELMEPLHPSWACVLAETIIGLVLCCWILGLLGVIFVVMGKEKRIGSITKLRMLWALPALLLGRLAGAAIFFSLQSIRMLNSHFRYSISQTISESI